MNPNLTNLWNGIKGIGSSIWNGIGSIASSIAPTPVAGDVPKSSTSSLDFSGNSTIPQSFQSKVQPSSSYSIPGVQTANAQAPVPQSSGLPYYMGSDNLPQSGTPEYNRIQSSLNNPTPTRFSIGSQDTYGSSSFNPSTVNDALSARDSAHNDMMSGSSSAVPSSDLLSSILPNYQNALQSYSDLTGKINIQRLAENQEINNMLQNGAITKEQAAAFTQETERRYNTDLSNLTVAQGSAANNVDVFSRLWSTFGKPTELSPGSSLVNPTTGQVVTQGNGAAPTTVFDSAMKIWSASPTYNTDGTPNYQPALDQAQSYYSTHQLMGGGSSPMQGPIGGSQQQSPQFIGQQSQDGNYTMPDGGFVNSSYAQKIAQNFLPQLQIYISSGPQGTAYLNSDKISKLPTGTQVQLSQAAAKAGIPTLDGTAAAGIQSVYSLYNNLDAMTDLVNQTLSSGTIGHATNWAKSKINDIFQNNPQLQNFNNLRTLAGQADTNLMGGIGSGFRQNTANLGVSIQNLPVASDSFENAMVKINATRKLLDSAMSKTFPGFQGSGSITSTGSQGGTSSNSQWSW